MYMYCTYLSDVPMRDGERKEGGMTEDLHDESLEVHQVRFVHQGWHTVHSNLLLCRRRRAELSVLSVSFYDSLDDLLRSFTRRTGVSILN